MVGKKYYPVHRSIALQHYDIRLQLQQAIWLQFSKEGDGVKRFDLSADPGAVLACQVTFPSWQ